MLGDRQRPAVPSVVASPSRRAVLTAAGAAALTSALAACNRQAATSAGVSPAADVSEREAVVNWASWPLYLDGDTTTGVHPTLRRFQDTAQITAAYDEPIDDNQRYYDSIQAQLASGQDLGQDLLVVTDWMAARFISQGYAQRLTTANIPKAANLLPRLRKSAFDPGREYTLTWQSGFTGIAWNKKQITKPLTGIQDLWRPDLKGQVDVLAELRDTMGLIMLDQGTDVSADFGSDAFGQGLAELEKQLGSGQIHQLTGNEYTRNLISGRTLACIAWSGDIRQLNAENGNQWEFVLPEAGSMLWSDDLLVPIGSPHKQNAEILMNYYYDPLVAAQVAAAVKFVCPVTGARQQMETVDATLVDDDLIFPSDAELRRAHSFRMLAPAEEAQLTADFIKVAGG